MAQYATQYTNLSNIPAPPLHLPWNEQVVLVQILVGIFLYVNCLMICTFFKKEAFRTDTRYILFAQTLFMDSALMVFTDVALIWNYFQITVNCIPCVIMCTIMAWLTLGTPLTLVAMCLERYVAICMPLRHASISTTRTRLLGLVLIWCLAGVPPLTVFFMFVSSVPLSIFSSYFVCSVEIMIIYNWQIQVRAALFQAYFIVMLVTIGFTYVKITAAARGASDNKKSASKGLRTVVLHTFQLLLCLIQLLCPYVEMAVMNIDYMLFINVRYSNFVIFSLTPRCLSPLIYGLRDEKFFVVLRYYAVFGLSKKDFCFCKLYQKNLKHEKISPLNGK
ncbi:odorant receptor 131-2-like [Megalops cyprinoides]|uniref:odorant receptor 131-2-like n=1 Tax=Megalops cyprinoides TaxID=118141 RepID=UPI001864702D|nr:odorant receptor 131-2-like [Megalops cyprinoides]